MRQQLRNPKQHVLGVLFCGNEKEWNVDGALASRTVWEAFLRGKVGRVSASLELAWHATSKIRERGLRCYTWHKCGFVWRKNAQAMLTKGDRLRANSSYPSPQPPFAKPEPFPPKSCGGHLSWPPEPSDHIPPQTRDIVFPYKINADR
jgi:hypothetical protein